MSTYVSNLYGQHRLPKIAWADEFLVLPMQPDAGIVLCRDADGNPTATFEDDEWDFTPYHFLPGRSAILRFHNVLDPSEDNRYLIEEMKRFVFFLIYCGNPDGINVTTLRTYHKVLRKLVRFCHSYVGNTLTGRLTIESLITNKSYLKRFVSMHETEKSFFQNIKTLLSNASRFPKGVFKLPVVKFKDLNITRVPSNQVPVIPTRIYMEYIQSFSNEISHLHQNLGRLEEFIEAHSDKNFAVDTGDLRTARKLKRQGFPSGFERAVSQYGLEKLFVGAYKTKDRREFYRTLTRMQYAIKQTIHMYTGMRDQEVVRLLLGCIKVQEMVPAVRDDAGVVRDPAREINIISTTTKLSKGLKTESWIATEEVIKAVEVAESICRGLARAIGEVPIEGSTCLFLGVSVFTKWSKGVLTIPYFSKRSPIMADKKFMIKAEDIDELSVSDPNRDFRSEPMFSVGKIWHLASHQFRRSLSFYASSSGFVSQPTLKKQFKHTSLLMTQYYSNNFENFRAVFGYFDSDLNDTLLPGSHIAYEFQIGMTNDAANQILSHLQEDSPPLGGGFGLRLQKLKQQAADGEVSIFEVRRDTERSAHKGEISYRRTLLGGCVKSGPCDNFILGEVTSCIGCEAAVLDEKGINDVVQLLEEEISRYPESSCEYQICKIDLQKLSRLRIKGRMGLGIDDE